jgi:hypothetical protein
MSFRPLTVLLLLCALVATRLLDAHFHLPPKASGEAPHLVAALLIDAHEHAQAPDHGHIASHLYEDEVDEEHGEGLLAKLASSMLLWVPVLLAFLLLSWRPAALLQLPARGGESPPRPRRRALLAPPSQAPPLLA